MNKCSCGCGNDCKSKFVQGHNRKGIPQSKETIAKKIASLNLPEVKERQKEGIKKSWTDEKKIKMSNFNKGKILSEEHKKKIGIGNTGKVRTEIVKEKIRNALIFGGYMLGDKNIMKNEEIVSRFKGDNNPNWKGGNSKGYKTGYYSTEYKIWRKTVFERDDYQCKKCNAKGVYLTAHHIKSFAHYPELRFEINNGLTLCEKCHSETDNYKGRNKSKKNINN